MPVSFGPYEATRPTLCLPDGAGLRSRISVNWGPYGGWCEGTIVEMGYEIGKLPNGERGGMGTKFRVAYDDGSIHWHNPLGREHPMDIELVRAGGAGQPWEQLELRCVLSHQRLDEPARGEL